MFHSSMLFYLLGVSRITKPEKSWKFKKCSAKISVDSNLTSHV